MSSKNESKSQTKLPAQAGALPSWYGDLLSDIKQAVDSARLRAQRAVNTELVQMYWEIGRLILERQQAEGWGTKVVERLAADLRTTFPNQRGFSRRNLMYMQQMARTWPEPIVQQPVAQLPWGHITILMSRLKTDAERAFYATEAVREGWSRDRLQSCIAEELFLRKGAASSNFHATLPEGAETVEDITKDPYRLDFLTLDELHSERELEDALVAQMIRFLTELGVGFAFVGRQYPLVLDDREYRIDLLFYHLKLRRYVVIELKTREAHPEHFGMLAFYAAAVDELVRDPERDEGTLGILICKHHNKAASRLALSTSNRPMAVSTYSAGSLTPEMRALLPSEEELSRVAASVLGGESADHGDVQDAAS
ncbi:PDDEXK nuclease domain-containing protein [Streptomyces sp. KLOTTS4A1]|uniref:PDDEXK nuclease domain-containing protein n=1 Tax=Streptomyces sp. KLOTTS4A1 TaxID=3390996 RepID=UPI0039F48AEC